MNTEIKKMGRPAKKTSDDLVITHEMAEAKVTDKNSKNIREKTIGGVKFRKTRDSYDQSLTKQLDIAKELLDNDLQYRWVNEENIARYQEGFDYAVITEEHFGTNKVSLRRRVGTKKDGSDRYVVLMATPKEWKHERDQARAERDSTAVKQAAEGQNLAGGALTGSEYVKQFKITNS